MGQWGIFGNSTRPASAQRVRAQPPTAEALAKHECTTPYTRQACRFYAGDRKLGAGAYGTVMRGTDISTASPVAIKFIPAGRMKPASLEREVAMLRRLSETGHPSLLRFYGHMCPDQVRAGAVRAAVGATDRALPKALDDCHALVMEVADGGEIFSHVVKCGGMAEAELAPVFGQLIDAVRLAHRMGIAHRDLKLENCLLSTQVSGDESGGGGGGGSGGGSATQRVKLIDWGLAHQHALDGDGEVIRERLHSRCGSRSYMAPEVTNRDISGTVGYDAFAADVWSLGVCLFAMLLGFFPFEQANPMLDWRARRAIEAQAAGLSTMETIFSFYPERSLVSQFSPGLIALLDRMLIFAPDSRATLAEVCTSEWLAPHLTELDVAATRELPKDAAPFDATHSASPATLASELHAAAAMQRTRSVSDSTAASVPAADAATVTDPTRTATRTIHSAGMARDSAPVGFSLAEQFGLLAERLGAERQDSTCTEHSQASHASGASSAAALQPPAAAVAPRRSAVLEPPPPSPTTPAVVGMFGRTPHSSRNSWNVGRDAWSVAESRLGVLPEQHLSHRLSSQDPQSAVATHGATEPQPTVVVAGSRRSQRHTDAAHTQLRGMRAGLKCEVGPTKPSRGSEGRSSSVERVACVPTSTRRLAALFSRACPLRSPRSSSRRWGSGEGARARASWARASLSGEGLSGVATVPSPVSANV